MNSNLDTFEPAWALYSCLSRGDMCRFIDRATAGLGTFAPVAQFEDDKSDAVWWRESQPHARCAVMWTAISDALTVKQLEAARAYLDRLIAEKQGGAQCQP